MSTQELNEAIIDKRVDEAIEILSQELLEETKTKDWSFTKQEQDELERIEKELKAIYKTIINKQ